MCMLERVGLHCATGTTAHEIFILFPRTARTLRQSNSGVIGWCIIIGRITRHANGMRGSAAITTEGLDANTQNKCQKNHGEKKESLQRYAYLTFLAAATLDHRVGVLISSEFLGALECWNVGQACVLLDSQSVDRHDGTIFFSFILPIAAIADAACALAVLRLIPFSSTEL